MTHHVHAFVYDAPITHYTPPPPDCRCVCGLTYADWQASRALWRRLLRWWRS